MGPLTVYRLEIYAGLLGLILATNLACYLFGRYQEHEHLHNQQLEADATAVHSILEEERKHADDDELARKSAEDFLDNINKGLTHVSAQYSKLPNVVVDSRGCERFADTFGLRWNAAASVSAEPADRPAASAPGTVLPGDVHATH